MKKLLIFGGSGGLGGELNRILSLPPYSYDVTAISSRDCDITNIKNFTMYNYDYVLNLSCVSVDALIHKTLTVDIERQLEVNCLGAINIIKYFTAQWREWQRPGKIILMSSFLSENPVRGAGIYSACKAFVDNLVKTAALENAKYGITYNSIQAGYFDAGLTHKLPKDFQETVKSKIPVGRFGRVEELASAIHFIFQNDYVTGTNLVIDGGVSLV